MAKTGMTLAGQRIWTASETKLLRRCYPDYRRACAALPGRTLNAIRSKARRLGITQPLRIWSDENLNRLKGPYRQGVPMCELTALFPGKTAKQIWGRAAYSGWRRPRKPPKPTGLIADDTVKAKAFAYKLTQRDLDALAGTRGYFLRRPSRTNWKNISRAVEVLDGQLSIEWPAQ
jgi:hypothetical protein